MSEIVACSIEGCEQPKQRRGMCRPHYRRACADGSIKLHRSPEERFSEYVAKIGTVPEARPDLGPCWLWLAALDQGYGNFSPAPKTSVRAHRWSYEQAKGPIPEGLHLDHLCRVRRCVNPDHLEPVTNGENTRRGLIGRGRLSDNGFILCQNDHEMTPENSGKTIPGGVSPSCRACAREKSQRYFARKAAAERLAIETDGSPDSQG